MDLVSSLGTREGGGGSDNDMSLNDEDTIFPTPSQDALLPFIEVREEEKRGKRGRRRPTSPPHSLAHYASQKGYWSVSDLVAPLWCEYLFQYNVLGMSHLPLSQRPETIVTPQGHHVKPDVAVAQQREKVMDAGKVVHERLEREIYPVKVYVKTTSKEDEWALRLLKIATGFKTLLESGCCRELPIFGFVRGHFVMGIVDEIEKRPIATSPSPSVSSSPLKWQSQTSLQKQWSSQEEWKKDKARRRTVPSGSSPVSKKIKATASPSSSSSSSSPPPEKSVGNQTSLASFFGGISSKKGEGKSEQKTMADPVPKCERMGLFLSDTKTRLAWSVPEVDDQRQSRLQCMLYKRIIDGLFAGLCEDNLPLDLDPFATPLTSSLLFLTLDLDSKACLSKDFIEDAADLCQDFKLTIPRECTLQDIAEIVRDTLRETSQWCRDSQSRSEGDGSEVHIIQNSLRLTYRRRKGRFESKRRSKRKKEISAPNSPIKREKKEKESVTTLPDSFSTRSTAKRPNPETLHHLLDSGVQMEDLDDETQLAFALQVSLGGVHVGAEDEGKQLLEDRSIVMPSTSSEQPCEKLPSSSTPSSSPSKKKTTAKVRDIIGTVNFLHDAELLDNHLIDVLSMWKGERSLRGVPVEKTWRCGHCEYFEGCEWREEKGKEKLEEAYAKKGQTGVPKEGNSDEELWSQMDDVPEEMEW